MLHAPVYRIAGLALTLAVAGCRSSAPAVIGTATFSGGPPLPPDAVLEATLLELSGAGAPGRVIGSVLVGGPGASPVPFRIPFDPAQIDMTLGYAVRARLSAERSVLYLSSNDPAVLTQGHGNTAAVSLHAATVTSQLPATFTGTLPCAACVGADYQIELLPDSVFYRRAIRRQPGDSSVRDDIGRWTLAADGARLVLEGDTVETFAPFGASVLRPLDPAGRPIAGGRDHELLRTSAAAALEPALRLRGLYRETGAGGVFADCRTRRPIPVDSGGDRPALAAAYDRTRARRGGELLVRLDGRIVRAGASRESAVTVTRFLGASRTGRC